MENKTDPKWTVETLARYLWEQAETQNCDDCRVKAVCFEYDCDEVRIALSSFGLKGDDDA